MKGIEIERKFLVAEVPRDLARRPRERIEQGYVTGGGGAEEVRLRRRAGHCWLTVKSGGGMERRETEVEITTAQFRRLWPLTAGRRLCKTRHLLPHGDLTLELDLYHGELSGLSTVEVEFATRAAAEGFTPPAWFGDEITADDRYRNRRLAADGLPSGED